MESIIEKYKTILLTSAALISAISVLIAAIKKLSNQLRRKQKHIPMLVGTKWNAEWIGHNNRPYVSDRIEFLKWTGSTTFRGNGIQSNGKITEEYPIEGEITPRGVVLINYKSIKFPFEGHTGTVCMTLNIDGNMSGYWIGHQKSTINDKESYVILPGTVEMKQDGNKIGWLRSFYYSLAFWI